MHTERNWDNIFFKVFGLLKKKKIIKKKFINCPNRDYSKREKKGKEIKYPYHFFGGYFLPLLG